MDKKGFVAGGSVLIIIQIILNLGIFVKYQDMTAYAVSKSEFLSCLSRLDRIENKLDRLMEK